MTIRKRSLRKDVTEEKSHQTFITNRLSNGEQQKQEEYFSKLYVGFWDGTYIQNRSTQDHYYPIPMVDNYYIDMFSNLYTSPSNTLHDFSMRLQRGYMNRKHQVKNRIDQSVKFTFQFIAKDGNIPDVQSIFYIHGKKYLAEKITATFSEDGMSQLLKMVAYRVV